MTPNIIEDSDGDESELSSPPQDSWHDAEHTKSSPHGIDHPSESTDPSFFNSVFNEQQNAAREQAKDLQVTGLTEESDGAAECLSFDQGFERVVVAKDSLQKSPWDVPSSPESMQPKRSAKRKTESSTRTKITRGLRRQLEDIGYKSPDDEQTTWERLDKRRRTQRETGIIDDLPSTLPVESEGSCLIAPVVTAFGQTEQYSPARTPAAFPSPTQPLKPCSINLRSSGSVTNVNTPRDAWTSTIKPSYQERLRSSAVEDGDVIHGGTPPPRSTCLAIKEDDEDVQNAEEVAVDDTCFVIKEDDENVPAEEPAGDDVSHKEECKPEPIPRTTKRTRGPPKKAKMVDVTVTIEDPEVPAKGKKKRGRPKKTEKVKTDLDKKVDDEKEASADIKATSEAQHPAQEPQPDQNSADLAVSTDIMTTETKTDIESQAPPVTSTSQAAEDPDCTVKKDVMLKKAHAAGNSSARQLYRVGLSKRTKIPSLLKVIRK
ncbi:hypothetical protein E4U16_006160 [Claviceps sp. LM84 group G4]|nr:hypothetical protein E4U33_000263 [Claviceps sp. LM78 group G4]KAG6085342.1 hypothetical protein E4U16_006160 [Claviceps sp. LM84 group G4]